MRYIHQFFPHEAFTSSSTNYFAQEVYIIIIQFKITINEKNDASVTGIAIICICTE